MKAKIGGIEIEGTPKEIAEYLKIKKEREGRRVACNCENWFTCEPSPYCQRCHGCGYYYED